MNIPANYACIIDVYINLILIRARKHSSRMQTACLPTVLGGGGVPAMRFKLNKFEHVPGGGGGPVQ